MQEKNSYQSKYKICVSGAAETGHCGLDAFDKAKELGREIIKQGGIIVTGATTGFPAWSAQGAKEAGGFSIGFSPASTEREHLEAYHLPLDYMDIVVFTGFGYSGRDLILVRSSDAVIVGCGRVGTINEFTVAYEDNRLIGVLRGSWETDETIQEIIEGGHRVNKKIVFDDDPERLVAKVIELIKNDRGADRVYRNYDGVSGEKGNLIL